MTAYKKKGIIYLRAIMIPEVALLYEAVILLLFTRK